MTSRPAIQCLTCKHYVSPFDREDEGARSDEPTQVCAAYPAGIPDEIWTNKVDHREPFEGDNGIRWATSGPDFPEYAMSEGGQ